MYCMTAAIDINEFVSLFVTISVVSDYCGCVMSACWWLFLARCFIGLDKHRANPHSHICITICTQFAQVDANRETRESKTK